MVPLARALVPALETCERDPPAHRRRPLFLLLWVGIAVLVVAIIRFILGVQRRNARGR